MVDRSKSISLYGILAKLSSGKEQISEEVFGVSQEEVIRKFKELYALPLKNGGVISYKVILVDVNYVSTMAEFGVY